MATSAIQDEREKEHVSFAPATKVSEDINRIVVANYSNLWTKAVARIHPTLSLSPEAEMVMQGIVDSLGIFLNDGTWLAFLFRQIAP